MAHDFIRAIAAKYEPKMIIIDTVQAIRSADKKEDYASVEEEFLALRHLAHELDIVVICVHHAKKVPDYAITPIDSILGLQGLPPLSKQFWLCRKCRTQKMQIFL